MAQPPKKQDEQPQHPLAPLMGAYPGAVAGMDKIRGPLPDYGGAAAAPGQPTLTRATPAPTTMLSPAVHSPVQPNAPAPGPGLARQVFDGIAQGADVLQAPVRAAADVANRFGVGVRNFFREGLLNKAPVEAASMDYAPTQGLLARVRGEGQPAPAAAPAAQPAAPTLTRAAATTAATTAPALAIADPSNPASMAAKPPAPAAPAAAGAAVAQPASVASAPATVPAQPTLRPGDVNTFTGSDKVTRAVPGMTAQPGTAAATGPVSVPAVATGVGDATQVNPVAAPQVAMPSLVNPRTLSGDLRGAEAERQARLSEIDSGLFDLRGNLNSRGKRELYATLLGDKIGLTRDRVGQVTDLEKSGAGLDAQAAQEQARLQAEAADQNAERTQRGSLADQASTLRRDELAQQGSEAVQTMKGEDGNSMLLRRNGSVTPITDASGKPFREQEKSGSISDGDVYSAYTAELKSINENTLLKPEERAARIQELEQRPEVAATLARIRGSSGGKNVAAATGDPLKDAQAAVASGRITREAAKARLVAAGYKDQAEKI